MLNKFMRNIDIGAKMSVAPTFAIVCLLVVAFLGYQANDRLTRSLTHLGDKQVPKIIAVADLSERLVQINSMINQSLAWEGVGVRQEKITQLDKSIVRELAIFKDNLISVEANYGDVESRDLLSQAKMQFDNFNRKSQALLDIKSGMLANAASYVTTMEDEYLRLRSTFKAVVDQQSGSVDLSVKRAHEVSFANRMAIFVGLALAAIVTVGIAWLTARQIIGPLREASVLASAMASGDLSVSSSNPKGEDVATKLLRSLDQVAIGISSIVDGVRKSANQVSQASSEIAAGNSDLSSRTENTAAALEQTSASLENLTGAIHITAQNVQKANQLATQALQASSDGGNTVQEAANTMNEINIHAEKIQEIISVIDGIAFQTNILALNAAVEAARAGEQGRGFAVVAGEVRALAKRSANAAKEIRALILTSKTRIELGVHNAQAAGQSMAHIMDSIKQVSHVIAEISTAASSQANGVVEISRAVAHMDRTTQQNAALVEQASAAANSLQMEATSLVKILQKFKLRIQ